MTNDLSSDLRVEEIPELLAGGAPIRRRRLSEALCIEARWPAPLDS
jgi:hypothetical protein